MPPRKGQIVFSSDDDAFSDSDEDMAPPPEEEFVPEDQGPSDEEDVYDRRQTNRKGKGKEQAGKDGAGQLENAYAWEASFERSWDVVQEDEEGSLAGAVEGILARGRRKRLQNATPLRRTIIRHLIILLDLSDTMSEKDFRPSRFDLTIEYVKEFVGEWFDQNPLGQIGIIALRSGLAERLVDMSGNPQEILRVLADKKKLEPAGEPSLQNGFDMARGSMSHLPTHSSREVLLLLSSLTSTDPGSISQTLNSLVTSKIRCSVVSLAAETKLAKDLSSRTGGTFGVAMNEGHLKDLIWDAIPPPALTAGSAGHKAGASAGGSAGGKEGKGGPAADLMMMGFPTRLPDTGPPTLCACHAFLKPEGFLCPRCGAKMCDVPTDCEVCGLLVVSSPHLARSYHHLFPVVGWGVVPIPSHPPRLEPNCHACSMPFPPLPSHPLQPPPGTEPDEGGVSPTGRYRCRKCKNDFCAECDAFVHESLHVCPGCG